MFGTVSNLPDKVVAHVQFSGFNIYVDVADRANQSLGWQGQHNRHAPADAITNNQTCRIATHQVADLAMHKLVNFAPGFFG